MVSYDDIKVGFEFVSYEILLEKTLLSSLKITHVVRPGGKVSVTSSNESKYGSRNCLECEISSGEKVLFVKTKTFNYEFDGDGIISLYDGKPKWLFHKKEKEFNKLLTPEDIEQYSSRIPECWHGNFNFNSEIIFNEEVTRVGLRPPQLGGLFSIGAHWSTSNSAGTVIMPTGTGKTETMISSLVAFNPGRTLVVVPSDSLRTQTFNKFIRLGLLRKLMLVNGSVENPVVGYLKKGPKTQDEINALKSCNVVVSTVSMITQKSLNDNNLDISQHFDCIYIDEAHHVGARTWAKLKDKFKGKRIMQFTATPFRRDGKVVDGKLLYSYPLSKAQREGYFKKIEFNPIFSIYQDKADDLIASRAIEILKEDLGNELDHVLMARCANIERAQKIYELYLRKGNEFNPILITSKTKISEKKSLTAKLLRRDSRILVCVDMFGEGFDLPQLKIAALHDSHKSLGIILQFTGRFTRTAEKVDTAKIVANIGNQNISTALEDLYSEDADWNELLSEYSSEAVKSHAELVDFLRKCERIDNLPGEEKLDFNISPKMFNVVFSVVGYQAKAVNLERFHNDLSGKGVLFSAWHNKDDQVLFFMTMSEPKVKWIRSKRVKDREWNLYVLNYLSDSKTLFIHSTDKSSIHQTLAQAVTIEDEPVPIRGDKIFRCLDGISRLQFHQVGLKKPARRNLRYSMYSGADVTVALTSAQTENSTKSNLSGTGYENGSPSNIGCSVKGRVWSREQGGINSLIEWTKKLSNKLLNENIDTTTIIKNVMIPKEVKELPDVDILCLDWPVEILNFAEEKIIFQQGESEDDISSFSLGLVKVDRTNNRVIFDVSSEICEAKYRFELDNTVGFKVSLESGVDYNFKIGKISKKLSEYLNDYPPSILFVDNTELDGNLHFSMENHEEHLISEECIEVLNWEGVDIKKESRWKNGEEVSDSIQSFMINKLLADFEIVIDDDDKGEAADIICINESDHSIDLHLFHCKYSGGSTPGERIKDVVEVCSQAIRSKKWKWKFKDLVRHIAKREDGNKAGRPTRFMKGSQKKLDGVRKMTRFKPVNIEISIVQPGIKKESLSSDQRVILNATNSYLVDTIGTKLKIYSS